MLYSSSPYVHAAVCFEIFIAWVKSLEGLSLLQVYLIFLHIFFVVLFSFSSISFSLLSCSVAVFIIIFNRWDSSSHFFIKIVDNKVTRFLLKILFIHERFSYHILCSRSRRGWRVWVNIMLCVCSLCTDIFEIMEYFAHKCYIS